MLSLSHLIEVCRTLRHSLGAGVAVLRVFGQLAERGPRPVRPLAARIGHSLQQGNGLADTLDKQARAWPPLFLAAARVGEETGHLPEVMEELEKHFRLQLDLRRQFRSQTFLLKVQLVLAVLVLATLILVLGLIAPTGPGVFGLRGPVGAAIFLGIAAGLTLAVWGGTKLLQRLPAWPAFLWKIPALGPCLESLALARLCLALRLTMETGMPIVRAVKLALNASGSKAYSARSDTVAAALKSGESLHDSLRAADVFPREFLEVVAVAEEVGSVPERLALHGEHYQEEAADRLKVLVRLASLGVWLLYAAFMVWAIMSIARMYLGALGG